MATTRQINHADRPIEEKFPGTWEPDMLRAFTFHHDNNSGIDYTNVPHLVTHHSPNGFAWGYGGSAPADTALNIAEWVMRRHPEWSLFGNKVKCWDGNECTEEAWHLHQQLKWEFVANLPRHTSAKIYLKDVEEWMQKQLSTL